jgi:hypothetical protein
MKIQELIDELQKIKSAHPDADINIECFTHAGNGYSHTSWDILDCRWEGRHAQIRAASPLRKDALRELLQIESEQRR